MVSDWKIPLHYQSLPETAFSQMAECLCRIGYCPDGVTQCLGLTGVDALYPLDYRWLPRWDQLLKQEGGNLSTAIRLLLLGLPESTVRLEKSLGAGPVGFLMETGLVFQTGCTVHPCLSLVPFEGRLVATDRLFVNADPEAAEQGLSSDNCVWRLDRTTLLMSKRLKRGGNESILELGSGSGVLSLLTAQDCPEDRRRNAKQVIGVDINPRAVNVAGFNAKLNGVKNARFYQGDLYQPVQGKRFDYIFSNPPSAPGLVRAWNREGGSSGRDMVENMIKGLDEHLLPGGVFQTTVHFGYRDIGDIDDWMSSLLDRRFFTFEYEFHDTHEEADVFALREAHQKSGARDYAAFKKTYESYAKGFAEWGISKICFGVLSVKRRAGP
jgi:carbamoyltransferase